ncbi:MAG TPA: 50S ribosomal protein L6 [Patescibacteria group bacterium]|jgi:large subunit ribosomal protein L6
MSRIARLPVPLADGVTLKTEGNQLIAKGKAAEVKAHYPSSLVKVSEQDGAVTVRPADGSKEAKAASGLVRSLVASVVAGAAEPFEKKLEFSGVGYRVVVQGDKLQLSMGYSHPVELDIPQGITAEVKKNVIGLKGSDAQVLGQFAAEVRDVRPPEPYKGKGIRYADEQIRRKAGKAAKGAEG